MLFIDPADNRLTSLGKQQQAGRGGNGGGGGGGGVLDERQRRKGAEGEEFTCGKKWNRGEEERML